MARSGKTLFRILAQLNRWFLPRFSGTERDLTRLRKWEQALIAWKYYVTTRAL